MDAGTPLLELGGRAQDSSFKSLSLMLGEHTTSPLVSIGVSVDYQEFVTVNVTAGHNNIPVSSFLNDKGMDTNVIRINAEGWQNNRVNLESIILNAGQFLPQGVDQAWPFLTGEYFKAEHNVNAQPGAALSDVVSYGNEHGLSFQFFRVCSDYAISEIKQTMTSTRNEKTEDTGYFYTTDHNFTTPWKFSRDQPPPTHVVIHIGANDAAQNVSAQAFVKTYLNFIARLRTIYPTEPFFVFTPWGWPNPDGTIGQYYEGAYQQIVNTRNSIGDNNVFLVNTTGWVTFADVFPEYGRFRLFEAWLKDWGLKPEGEWAAQH
ncbi:hypothetical protein NLI96_g7896 [Meripilus lineatus]|uniref:SGNH hydrolase-type esterase domain-containing protein n=1 Tax=Meripilus lineatus TaxID=2056292 RepID=A0AAD5YGR1_9APHY|nr:hypothetical protein NLI96_g7896 [Physisporinus lineatus]